MGWKARKVSIRMTYGAGRAPSLERTVTGRIALIFLLSGLLSFVLARALAMRRFQDLERGDLLASTRQVFLELDREVAAMHPLICLYAEANDLVDNLRQPGPDFLESHFGGRWAEANDVDFVLMVGPDGRRTWSSSGFGRYPLDLPESFSVGQFNREDPALYRHNDGPRPVEWTSGLVGQDGKVWLYCSHVILGTGRGASGQGHLVFGRRLDRRKLPAFDPDSGPVYSMVQGVPEAGPRERGEAPTTAQFRVAGAVRSEVRREGRSLVSYSPLMDVYGRPLAVLRLAIPRRDEATGQRMLNIIQWVGLSTFLASLALVVLTVRGTVVMPVKRLARAFSHRGGERNHLLAVSARRRDEIGQLAGRAAAMLAQIQEQNAALERQASTDRLTGLANRRLLETHFHLEIRRLVRRRLVHGERVRMAVVMADVDHFKFYNDTYGHLAGDQCLKMVADAIHACAARPGDLACRFGGEEFVLVLPDTDLAGALTVAEAVRAGVVQAALPHRTSPVAEVVTVSLGVAAAEATEALTLEALIEAADRALYRAKSRGRNQVATAANPAPGGAEPEPVAVADRPADTAASLAP